MALELVWMVNLLSMLITSQPSLGQAADYLRDGWLLNGTWSYDRQSGTVTVPVWQLDRLNPNWRYFLRLRCCQTYKWRKAILVFDHAFALHVQTTRESPLPAVFHISGLEYDAEQRHVIITTHYVLDLAIEVRELSGSLRETEDVSWNPLARESLAPDARE
jgi:hypothetical protein